MTAAILHDDPQTVELLHSMTHLMRWMRSVPMETRQRFLAALAECSDEVQEVVFRMVSVVDNPDTTPLERQRALATIADALFVNPDDEGAYGQDLVASEANAAAAFPAVGRVVEGLDSQEATFARRLRELMTNKCVTQQELAQRIGCSQPAISQMLTRNCRPQKKTLFKLAEALDVQPRELWPDLDVTGMLDAVAGFQQDDYIMTEAEANALRDTTRRNTPTIPVRALPVRRR